MPDLVYMLLPRRTHCNRPIKYEFFENSKVILNERAVGSYWIFIMSENFFDRTFMLPDLWIKILVPLI